jgi:glutamate dehydrogenase
MARHSTKKTTLKSAGKITDTKSQKFSRNSIDRTFFPKAPELFINSFYANVLPADLEDFLPGNQESIPASIWSLGQQRKPGKLKLRLFNPSPITDGWTVDHTVLEIVTDDMPFLVDSVTGALQRHGLTVHLGIHPDYKIRRDANGKLLDVLAGGGSLTENSPAVGLVTDEVFMHFQLDHCLDESFLKNLDDELREVLADVRKAVEDWPKMRERMAAIIALPSPPKKKAVANEDEEEVRAFLHWLDSNNFTYLGYRDIDLIQENGKLVKIEVVPDSGLGILRDPALHMFGGLRDLSDKKNPALQRHVRQQNVLVITKTKAEARVHRAVPMDAIFVRRFNDKGDVIGERLFVGLFTSRSYLQNPNEIPFLRRKIKNVLDRAAFNPAGHDGKAMVHILHTYPRDELFQISEDELFRNSFGILQLQERARVALFVRRDPFERFVTCLIYVPRDRYDSTLRGQIHSLLEQAFGGKSGHWHVRIDDSPLAWAFVTIYLPPAAPRPDIAKLESELRQLGRGWTDQLRDCLVAQYGEATGLALLRHFATAFPLSYRDTVTPAMAVRDIQHLERRQVWVDGNLVVDLSPPQANGLWSLKLFHAGRTIALSAILPLIENAGLKIEHMNGPFEIKSAGSDKSVFIHEFIGRSAFAPIVGFDHIKPAFEEAFGKIWAGEVENDLFNALTLRAGMGWQEVRVLRAFARYLRQLRIPYSHEMMASTFLTHAVVARQIYNLFFARHNPEMNEGRAARCKDIDRTILQTLETIDVLEEDRIIRRYLNLVQASLRTNFFQLTSDGTPKPYLSIKFDSRTVDYMPLPKPLYEIFVYSPRTEAVHLRGGKVARGGIRWSDRRDDFRNEILGLMKAQMVKNSVIVPVGSKGGFIVKKPPAEADKYQAEGIACYRMMMCGLLDITDNRVGKKIVPPKHVVRHDGDDPYLVVAADKGTAKFSDIANSLSQEYGFWLDDAFASGGSAGYDHKGMAITARGAWEAVKRHFRELGKDIQATDFTCIGVGDMSGDVFGNAMLQSKHIRLLGAFDHRHVFCDPSPDAAISFGERQRLFGLPRSSWADYDTKKMSKGGGVFSRGEKIIKITPEMKKAYGIMVDQLPPTELIQAMLKADIELLYFGGIGTFIKASHETNESVGDRVTESMRIDGCDLNAKVVGEGANLGVTQLGRIEYALKGGRINTDAIDNSAGVDTSDHEVNIKILLRQAVDRRSLTIEGRNKVLYSMTEDVAKLVLRDNYLQTQAISVAEAQAVELLPLHIRSMHLMEKDGLLNRAIEYLPDGNEISERQRVGKGLTRPELSVLLAYSKISLYEQLLASDLPDDEAFQGDLIYYFPELVRKKYGSDILLHGLRREIVATTFVNSIINRAGSHFMLTMADRTGKPVTAIARAYLLTREAFGLRPLWHAIENLDGQIPAHVQYQMLLTINQTISDAVQWFLVETNLPSKMAPTIMIYSEGIEQLVKWLEKRPPAINGPYKKAESELVAQGVPTSLARRVAMMPVLGIALDLTRLADQSGSDIGSVAEVFFGLGHRLGFDWLVGHAHAIVVQTPWQREAIMAILEDLNLYQRHMTAMVVGKSKSKAVKSAGQKLSIWFDHNAENIERYDALLNQWRVLSSLDVAMLTLASRKLAALLG